MKLKLQFWKTNKAVAVSVLECEGIPATTDDGAIEVCFYHATELFSDGEMILNNHETGKISTIEVDNPEEYVDKLVNNITRELFVPKQQEVKVGDIVKLGDSSIICYEVLHILPEEYHNRYIIATDCNKTGLPVVYAHQTVIPVNKRFTVAKEFTGNVETYTWET